MDSINFVVLGEQSIANDFGKKGTTTDLTLYDRKESNTIRTVSYTHLTLPTILLV